MALPVTNQGTIRTINDFQVPEPSVMKQGRRDISDTAAGRSLSGRMYKGKVATATELQLQWNAITPGEANTILSAVETDQYFPVRYYDIYLNDYRTATFYVGDRDTDVVQFIVNNERVTLSFTLIERL